MVNELGYQGAASGCALAEEIASHAFAEDGPRRDGRPLVLYICFYHARGTNSTTIFGHLAKNGVAKNWGLTTTARRTEGTSNVVLAPRMLAGFRRVAVSFGFLR